MVMGALSLAACSLVDLSELTNGALSPGGEETDGANEGGTSDGEPDATFADDGAVVPDDDAGGHEAGGDDAGDDAGITDASDADVETDASLEDATTGPTCGVTEFQSPGAAGNVYQAPDDTFFSANEAWTFPKNALAEDGKVATANATASVSQFLLVRDFGFTLSDAAVIQGVEVQIVRASTESGPGPGGSIVEGSVRLRLENTDNSQGSRTLSGTWTSTMTTVAYGNATDTWDDALTGAIVNKPAFGVLFSFRANSSQFGAGARVDAIRVRLHYCQ